MNNKFNIVIPLYNVEEWIKYTIRSVKAQSYKNFKCIILDDMSTDNTVSIIKDEIKNDDRFILVINNKKEMALGNIYKGIKLLNLKDDDIIVRLDGDDWLASKDVLKILNENYNKYNCKLTYGSYSEHPSGNVGKFARQIPDKIIESNSFRQYEWSSSHLVSFKYDLWKRIKKEDLLDKDGSFYKMTCDLAIMFPMLEMAGKNSKYINDILYVYNNSNPLNDHKINNQYQLQLEQEIRNGRKYKPVQ
jgi:glycosyltransferase involved in cell wall biosynthesis